MLLRLKKSKLSKVIVMALLVNFINLTANFYHASVMDSSLLRHQDPIDSLTELVLEFILEMDEETIPDTEIPHEKKKISDLKFHYLSKNLNSVEKVTFKERTYGEFYANLFESLKKDVNAPPPRMV
ncbi:hypothetical protein [Cecembia rubra]|uniref:Uncharacterized protein n=1 Tax=Cecembia rubra TaxID=1485585 RepID=A0A2P8EEJ3_9BACT|nr:hypothetical protein [Cecembia rubra]PSL07889.1 hypothetical protein CLV48_101828 [Cecembia rubra]